MERALGKLTCDPDFALIDAITCEIAIPQVGLIDGDAISVSIAAASILAKTERDRYMRRSMSRMRVTSSIAMSDTAQRCIWPPCANTDQARCTV